MARIRSAKSQDAWGQKEVAAGAYETAEHADRGHRWHGQAQGRDRAGVFGEQKMLAQQVQGNQLEQDEV